MDYITLSDVTHVHFKQFTSATTQSYIDEANTMLEDLAQMLGVAVEEIVDPVPFVVKRYLSSYCVMRLAQDSIGTNSVTRDEDIYVHMYEEFRNITDSYKSQITPEVLTGTVDSREDRSVSTGRYYRG